MAGTIRQKLESRTKVDVERVDTKIIWKIDNFPEFLRKPEAVHGGKKGELVESHKQTIGQRFVYTVWLTLYPNGDKRANEKCVSAFFTVNPSSALVGECGKWLQEPKVKGEISVEGLTGPEYTMSLEHIYCKTSRSRGWSNFIPHQTVLPMLKDGILTIRAHMFVITGVSGIVMETRVDDKTVERWPTKLVASLFDNEKWMDVTFLVKDDSGVSKVKAHKAILAQKSDVFDAMLSSKGFAEGCTGDVEISDTFRPAFQQFVRYIYTEEMPEDEWLMEVAKLSDKYNISELKADCQDRIAQNVSMGNVLEYLIFAHTNNLEVVKLKCLQFIRFNLREFVKQPDWFELLKENVDLAIELSKEF